MITTSERLHEYLEDHRECPLVGFDTEFVSEDTYRPELSLIQVIADQEIALIDPYAIEDLSDFWNWLTADQRTVVVHACREELRFIYQATRQIPKALFDIQIAAGFLGIEYPASYGNLVNRLMGVSLQKGETRTNWRHRPLTKGQSQYAAQDVEFLLAIYEMMVDRLRSLERYQWVLQEIQRQQNYIIEQETSPRWRSLSGIGSLQPRELEIARQLWHWRDGLAKKENRPPRRVIRDDMICELAQRKSAKPDHLRMIRGVQHRRIEKHFDSIVSVISDALNVPDSECPQRNRNKKPPQRSTLAQFIYTAISDYCQRNQMAPNLVATMSDIREYLELKLGSRRKGKKSRYQQRHKKNQPLMTSGWRGEFILQLVEDVLNGKLVAHVANPTSDQPLSFVPHSAINPSSNSSDFSQ